MDRYDKFRTTVNIYEIDMDEVHRPLVLGFGVSESEHTGHGCEEPSRAETMFCRNNFNVFHKKA